MYEPYGALFNEPLGYDEDGLPIWLISGAEDPEDAEDGEADGADEEGDGADEEDETDEGADDKKHPPSGKKVAPAKAPAKKAAAAKASNWTPPSKAEWERTQAALQKLSQKERAARTAQLEKARKEGMDEAATKAREDALKEAEDRYMPILISKEAKLALAEAGCKNPARLVNLVDRSKCQVQDDGDILGLEGEVNRIKEEWPELFKSDDEASSNGTRRPVKKAAPAAKVGAADKKDDDKDKKPSGATKIAQRLLGANV